MGQYGKPFHPDRPANFAVLSPSHFRTWHCWRSTLRSPENGANASLLILLVFNKHLYYAIKVKKRLWRCWNVIRYAGESTRGASQLRVSAFRAECFHSEQGRLQAYRTIVPVKHSTMLSSTEDLFLLTLEDVVKVRFPASPLTFAQRCSFSVRLSVCVWCGRWWLYLSLGGLMERKRQQLDFLSDARRSARCSQQNSFIPQGGLHIRKFLTLAQQRALLREVLIKRVNKRLTWIPCFTSPCLRNASLRK